MVVDAVRGIAVRAIAAKACSDVALSRKDERRGRRPDPLRPAILDKLLDVFWEMFERPPAVCRLETVLGGPTYDWVQEVLVIARDRLEPELMREAEKRKAALPAIPEWMANRSPSSVKQPAGFERQLSQVEKAILSAINGLLGSGAMGEELQDAVRRWKGRSKAPVR
jgi:hypothetical protein